MLKFWRFITLMLASLDMGLAFSHLMQLPPRMMYDASTWRVTQSMYYMYGSPVAIAINSGAWLGAIVLAFLMRKRRSAFHWALAGALCFVLAQTMWFLLVAPVNAHMEAWTPATMPPDWQSYRSQWEYTHAGRAVLQIIGFGCLIMSVLADPVTP